MAGEPIAIQAVLVKTESTYGTDASPAAGSDEVQVEEHFFNNLTIDHLEDNTRDQAGTTMGVAGDGEVSTGQFANLELSVALRGAGSAFSAASDIPANPLLESCGLSSAVDTTSGSETVTYTQDTPDFTSSTIYAYSANKEYQLTGCLGNVVLTFTPGQLVRARFSMQGLVSAINEASLPGSLSFSSTTPPAVKGAGLTVDGFDPSDFQDFEVDLGMNVVERPGGNASTGHAGFWIAEMSPTASATYEVPSLSSHDPYNKRDSGTEFSWDLGPMGPAQYNKIKVSGSAGRITSVGHSDLDGLAQYQVDWQCRNSDATTLDGVTLEIS